MLKNGLQAFSHHVHTLGYSHEINGNSRLNKDGIRLHGDNPRHIH